MTASSLSTNDLQANILRSRGHVAKQEELVERLTLQGHAAMAGDAAAILETMRGHLEIELTMLARMEAGAER